MYIAGSHDMGLTDEAQRPGAGLDVPTETGQADHAAEHHAVIDARRPLRHCCFPPSWASRAEATRDRLRKQQRSYWPSTRASPRQFSIGKKPSTHRHYRDEIVLCNGVCRDAMASSCCADGRHVLRAISLHWGRESCHTSHSPPGAWLSVRLVRTTRACHREACRVLHPCPHP